MIDIAAERRAMFEHQKQVRRHARSYTADVAGLERVESDKRFWLSSIDDGRYQGKDPALISDWAHEARLCDAIREDILAEMNDGERSAA